MFSTRFKIGNRILSETDRTLTIAEIGINHEGDFRQCLKLLKQAKISGADFAKLQIADPDKNYAINSESYKLFRQAKLSKEEIFSIYKYAKKIKLNLFSTFDKTNFNFFEKLKPICYKISSSLFKDYFFIKEILSKNKPVLISTGMSSLEDISYLLKLLNRQKNKKIVLMHCVSLYPTSTKKINLSRINLFRNKFAVMPGFSDHTKGIECAVSSIHYGVKIIEKHFTLNKTKEGFDHKISIEPNEFRKMVEQIKFNETIRGTPNFKFNRRDQKKINSGTRHYILNKNLNLNSRIKSNYIDCVKLDKNINSDEFYKIFPKILNNKTKKKLKVGAIIKLKDFK